MGCCSGQTPKVIVVNRGRTPAPRPVVHYLQRAKPLQRPQSAVKISEVDKHRG